jgi:putative DNA primase/helicase
MVGYALVGVTIEDALFFLFGRGGNGKSTFLDTTIAALGEYHTTAPMEAFIASDHDRHPTELAGLRGARLVTASETEEDRRFAEAKLKRLTGGDPISARFMRQDFFEYIPQFTLVFSGNHRPGVSAVDDAIRRRIYMVPFTYKIPDDERIKDYEERLKPELPGIMAWFIQGCLEWQCVGLAAPDLVKAETEQYLTTEDTFAAWLEEKTERDPSAFEVGSRLFEYGAATATRPDTRPALRRGLLAN